jgi:FkbM family methyltransferase
MIRHAKKIRAITIDEEPDFPPLQHLIRAGDSVIDLGANMGFYTKYLSDLVGPSGHVYSVEPIPSTVRILRYVVDKLRLSNVSVIHCAVSDHNGNAMMEIPLFDSGEENIFEAKIIGDSTSNRVQQVNVETKTLDSLFGSVSHKITFIKCDIEGHELRALSHAKCLLQQTKPAWLIEVWGNPDDTASDAGKTFKIFEDAQYQAFYFNGTTMKKRLPGETNVNYFFLASAHVELLLQCYEMRIQDLTSTVSH